MSVVRNGRALASAAGSDAACERGLQAKASAPAKTNARTIRMFMNPGGGVGWPPSGRERRDALTERAFANLSSPRRLVNEGGNMKAKTGHRLKEVGGCADGLVRQALALLAKNFTSS